MEFVPDLVNTDERRCTKFEQGLRLEIRERLTMTREPDLGHLLKQAYRAEELVRFKQRQNDNGPGRRPMDNRFG